MTKKKSVITIWIVILFVIIPVVLLLFFITLCKTISSCHQVQDDRFTTGSSHPSLIHPLKFYDADTFYDGINKAKTTKKLPYTIYGGIIPHHLFPGFIIADFFHRLSMQKPKTIIILGPNHYELGNFDVLTSLSGWQTPFGIVEPDEKIIRSLIKSKKVQVDEQTLPDDHAVAGSMPFIKYYLPEVKVVPLLLSGKMTKEETQLLAQNLKENMTEEVVLIAAVDFSHYLTNKQAQEKDILTLEVMKNHDYRQLFSLGNDYLDSPPSIAALLIVMDMLSKKNMDILFHTNSGELQHDDLIQTTSYFSITYH